jgi:hypothetical protein
MRLRIGFCRLAISRCSPSVRSWPTPSRQTRIGDRSRLPGALCRRPEYSVTTIRCARNRRLAPRCRSGFAVIHAPVVSHFSADAVSSSMFSG